MKCSLLFLSSSNITGKKIKRLRCDNGKEYINKDIFRLAKEKGILIEPCPPYVHELNGTAERYNRSVMNTARYLLADAKVHTRFWPEVVKTATYLKNRTLTNTIVKKTPYEIMFGEKPDISNLKLYGSKVFVRIPEVKRENKWASKANLGILLGYEDVGYRVLVNNKIIIARHVDVIEENVKLVGFQGDDNNNEQFSDDFNDKLSKNLNDKESEINSSKDSDLNWDKNKIINEKKYEKSELRRSTRVRNQPDSYRPENYCIYVNYVSADSPENYNEPINSNDSENWQKAMDREIESLKKNWWSN